MADKLLTETDAPPARPSYRRSKNVPRTPAWRLEMSAADTPRPQSEAEAEAKTTEPDTVLYLAYGSNLCAETFLGMRGIRPLSQVGVSAPSLRLTFDLSGMPYTEPCFANTAPRKIPGAPPPRLPDPRDPMKPPPVPSPPGGDPGPAPMPGQPPRWDKGLIGAVYEVTREDYQHIVATEGGGASYKEILVPCLAIPPRMSVPEKPPGSDIPRPFLARTLCAPRIPDAPDGGDGGGDGDDGGDGDGPDDPRKKWYWKFLRGPRREEDYAQPSARYLKLITDGAREHDLPDDYQRYLNSLQPYTVTTRRQRVGQAVVMVMSLPVMLMMRYVLARLADDKGRLPTWAAVAMGVWFSTMWMVYDGVLKPLFGDGERTEEEDEEGGEKKRVPRDEEQGNPGHRVVRTPWSERWRWYRSDMGTADEKRCLMRDWETNG